MLTDLQPGLSLLSGQLDELKLDFFCGLLREGGRGRRKKEPSWRRKRDDANEETLPRRQRRDPQRDQRDIKDRTECKLEGQSQQLDEIMLIGDVALLDNSRGEQKKNSFCCLKMTRSLK